MLMLWVKAQEEDDWRPGFGDSSSKQYSGNGRTVWAVAPLGVVEGHDIITADLYLVSETC